MVRCLLIVTVGLACIAPAACAAEAGAFATTWKLLSSEQKLHFVSGYLYGLRDAQRIHEIASEYVKMNPAEATVALEKLRPLYDLSAIGPEKVVRELDTFYGNPEQNAAPLSLAMSAARNNLLGRP